MVDIPEIDGPRISDERLMEIIRKKAFRYEEAFMFVGTCRDMRERIAKLEAEVERLTNLVEVAEDRIRNLKLEAKSLSRTGAVKVLIDAAAEFCRRVEAGEVRSKRSYAAFKEALSALEPAATCKLSLQIAAEARQDDKPVAWRVTYASGEVVFLSDKPVGDSGVYECEPLFARPVSPTGRWSDYFDNIRDAIDGCQDADWDSEQAAKSVIRTLDYLNLAPPAPASRTVTEALENCTALLETMAENAQKRGDVAEWSMMSVMAERSRKALTAAMEAMG